MLTDEKINGLMTVSLISSGANPDVLRAFAMAIERAVIDSQPKSSIPDGWKLVPIEPTEEMIEGFWGEIKHGKEEIAAAKEAYFDMLAAAPSPEVK